MKKLICSHHQEESQTVQLHEEPTNSQAISACRAGGQGISGQPTSEEDCNPLHFWKEQKNVFPILSEPAKKYLAIPASSAPVERLFSVAGKTFRPERCRLNSTTFQTLMMIKSNGHILKKICVKPN
ncbi:zinc finger BED domain-containing protein 4-like [Haliotis rubra]|uniref:zinc finger BED domain-containing protein 4-like n=1 Tax=Haliotis rubra TaxID=36100 RepID=UPI001EE5A67A|nr:zinc finger BED domain-containing protein 4-like [Haliotis rubra]